MGNTDSIPVVSQAKSAVQLVCGDTDGAAKTQENFLKECPGVSQVTSVVQVLSGDVDGALETQKRCGKGLINMADGIPVVGHAKGVIHYVCGDEEGGNQAMKSATRTTGVLAGGAGGFLLGGPAGAVAGGIYGGTVMDVGTTIVTKESTGYVAGIENAIKNPNAGDLFDLAMMPVFDGIAGHSAGNMVQETMNSSNVKTNIKAGKAMEAKAMGLYEAMEAKKDANPSMPNGEYLEGMKKAQNLYDKGKAMQGKPTVYPVDHMKHPPLETTVDPCVYLRSETKSQQQQQRRRYNESESDSDDDEDCVCKHATIPVLYVNIRSLNPRNRTVNMRAKMERLRSLIIEHQPRLIAIVESWLTSNHSDSEIRRALGLDSSYEIYRQDRRDGHNPGNAYGHESNERGNRRGGGILVAWRTICPICPYTEMTLQRESSEDYADNIVNFKINCRYSCKKCTGSSQQFAFTVVYRRPSRFNDEGRPEYDRINTEVVDRLIHIPYWNEDRHSSYTSWALVGDFNWNNESILNKFHHDVAEVVRMSRDFTHNRGRALDQVYAKRGFVTRLNDISSDVVDVTDHVSDHSALVFQLKLGKDYPSHKRCRAKRCSK